MTHTAMDEIGELRAVMEGPVIAPGDPGFDEGRRVWNAQIDRRPSVIARCASAADVAAAIGFAREYRLEVSVRGGGHGTAGTAVCDDGLMVDLSLLNEVTVDPAARRARVGGGALLADLDAATLARGLAIEVITEHVPRKNSPMSLVLFYRLDGAYCRAGDDETAFSGGRSPRYNVFIIAVAPDAEVQAAERDWVRGLWEALSPYAIGSGDGYINGMTDFYDDRVRGSYGAAKYDRLARIKAEYDPDNVFHLNANIRPAWGRPNGTELDRWLRTIAKATTSVQLSSSAPRSSPVRLPTHNSCWRNTAP
jgi:FAD binding domain/Berberine and berberine like